MNRVNIFIGPNNSGKSRLLRSLFASEFRYEHSNFNLQQYKHAGQSLQREIDKSLRQRSMHEVSGSGFSGIKNEIEKIMARLNQPGLPNDLQAIKQLGIFINKLTTVELNAGTPFAGSGNPTPFRELSISLQSMAEKYAKLMPTEIKDFSLPSFKKIYTPMLRGLRPVQMAHHDSYTFAENFDNYKSRTIADYFPIASQGQKAQSFHIVSGLTLYEEVKRMLLGSIAERDRIKAFELFLSQTFFNAQLVSLTPNIDKDCLYVTIGNVDRPIYDLGDGVQSIIILLYPIFLNASEDLLCFIEEPELSLHPGMQRLFIDTIMNSRFNKVQFFFTTHSNHFLDMTLDHSQISIFNFRQIESENGKRYTIENTQNQDIQLLDSIGVRNSSVFTSNCTVWVEGITDRLYLNRYMEMLQRQNLKGKYESERLKEDLHFSYIEYGGANIVHYSFDDEDNWGKIKASKISSKIMLVMDEDNASDDPDSAKYKRIQDLKAHLGDRLVVLSCREIENTLSKNVLESVILEWEGNNPELQFDQLEETAYKSVYLGRFIAENVPGIKRTYAAKSGTISNKVQFCRTALKYINAIEDLSEDGRNLAKKVLHFIQSNNS